MTSISKSTTLNCAEGRGYFVSTRVGAAVAARNQPKKLAPVTPYTEFDGNSHQANTMSIIAATKQTSRCLGRSIPNAVKTPQVPQVAAAAACASTSQAIIQNCPTIADPTYAASQVENNGRVVGLEYIQDQQAHRASHSGREPHINHEVTILQYCCCWIT